ncbi:putative Ig domain-containing protein [Streptomyces sp. NPDC050658]|uniref:putative Ig domain-containing protein n=1 Tax=unclassified Streptomyces TaxID=2593676 RepID=UPI0034163899
MHIFDIATSGTTRISDPGDQTSEAGTPITDLQIDATASAPEHDLTYSTNALPPGLSMGSAATVSGTPTSPGTYTVTVTATDTIGSAASTTFTWTITPNCEIIYADSHNDTLKTYTARIDIKNIGTRQIADWTLGFAFRGDQRIDPKWAIGGNYSQSGKDATITKYSFRPGIDPNTSAPRIALAYGRYTNSFAPPNTFTLNGATCVDNIS